MELSGEDGGGGGRTTADDSGDETDPQQETVVEGHGAYHDLRQFALKQSLQAANEHSDTDSSVINPVSLFVSSKIYLTFIRILPDWIPWASSMEWTTF